MPFIVASCIQCSLPPPCIVTYPSEVPTIPIYPGVFQNFMQTSSLLNLIKFSQITKKSRKSLQTNYFLATNGQIDRSIFLTSVQKRFFRSYHICDYTILFFSVSVLLLREVRKDKSCICMLLNPQNMRKMMLGKSPFFSVPEVGTSELYNDIHSRLLSYLGKPQLFSQVKIGQASQTLIQFHGV